MKNFPLGYVLLQVALGMTISQLRPRYICTTSIFTIYIMSGPSQIYIYKCYCYSIISYNMYCSTYQGVLPLSAQLEMFQNYKTKLTALVGAKRASNITSNGLYLLSSGNNDIALTYSLVASRIKFFPNYADTLVVSASNFLKVCEFLLCWFHQFIFGFVIDLKSSSLITLWRIYIINMERDMFGF